MNTAGRPWWQQVTALVSVTTGGAITGFSFVPHTVADIKAPANVPIHLLALEKEVQRPAASDSMLRSAIVNVTRYFLRMARTKSPAEMQAVIWQHDSIDGADHGASCAAFASLTLELAAQVVGQQSWVTGGTSYPWPLHKWADVRVDPNPGSLGITSVLQDAQAHHRWHPVDSGYQPLPGDWVLFDGHIEVITSYQHGVLQTVGGDSLPDFSVNAHEYHDPLAAQGVAGFVNNGAPDSGQTGNAPTGLPSSRHRDAAAQGQQASATPASPQPAGSGSASGAPDVPGVPPPQAPAPQVPAPTASAAAAAPGAAVAAIPGLVAPGPADATPGPPAHHHGHTPPGRGPGQARGPATASPAASAGGAAIPGLGTVAPGTGAAAGPAAGPRTGHPAATVAPAAGPALPAGPAPAGSPASAEVPGAGFAEAAGLPAAATGGAAIPGLLTATAAQAGAAAAHGTGHGSPAHAPASPGAPAAGQYVRHEPALPASPGQGTAAQEAFIRSVAPGAIAAQQRYGVPASVTIAQAIDESGWGASSLAAHDHNLFGIKGTGPAGSDPLPTQEYVNGQWITVISPFRVYASAAQSIEDHGKLLATSGYYQRAMADRHDPNAFAAALTGVYATDPGYGAKIIAIMQRYDLYRYDGPRGVPAAPAAAASPDPGSASPAPTNPAPTSPVPASPAPTSPAPSPVPPTVTPSPIPPGGTPSPAPSGVMPSPGSPIASPAPRSPDGTRAPSAAPPSSAATAAPPAIPGVYEPAAAAVPAPSAPAPSASAPSASAPLAHAAPRSSTPRARTAAPASQASAQRPRVPRAGVTGPAARPPRTPPAQRDAAGTTAAQDQNPGTAAARPAGGTRAGGAAGQPQAQATAGSQGAPSRDRPATRGPAPEVQTLAAVRLSGQATRAAAESSSRPPSRQGGVRATRYRQQLPPSVRTAFTAMARVPLLREEPLYREVGSRTGVRWELLAACDWMQCEAHPRYSPVRGEKLGTRNPDGTIYRTKTEALDQCAADLVSLPRAVYGIDVASAQGLSVEELAHVFAAFRWGGLLKAHHTSAMEFPYSVAGLNSQRLKMRWPNIDDPNAPDRPGTRFRMPFGAVPVVLCLNYPATV